MESRGAQDKLTANEGACEQRQDLMQLWPCKKLVPMCGTHAWYVAELETTNAVWIPGLRWWHDAGARSFAAPLQHDCASGSDAVGRICGLDARYTHWYFAE